MARPREFDPDIALKGAMEAFWKNGYGATNLPDLLKAMGLTRGSFYKAFKDKRSVYLAALKCYRKEAILPAVELLSNSEVQPARSRIEALFESIGSSADRWGCLLCNAMVELAPVDQQVEALTQVMTQELEQGFADALSDADSSDSGDSIARRAAALTRLYLGAQAASKTGEQRKDWRVIIGGMLADA